MFFIFDIYSEAGDDGWNTSRFELNQQSEESESDFVNVLGGDGVEGAGGRGGRSKKRKRQTKCTVDRGRLQYKSFFSGFCTGWKQIKCRAHMKMQELVSAPSLSKCQAADCAWQIESIFGCALCRACKMTSTRLFFLFVSSSGLPVAGNRFRYLSLPHA